MRMTEPNDPPHFTYSTPSVIGDLERAAAAADPRQFIFDLVNAIDELLLLFKPKRYFQLSAHERQLLHYFAHRAFEAGRSLKLADCDINVLQRGLRGVVGLGDVLTLPVEERDEPSQRQRERASMAAVKRLRHAALASQLAIDGEPAGADVELPPLGDLRQLAGPTATVLPFRLETREAIQRREARQADAATALWKRATDCFRAAYNLDDPATPYAAGLRLLSEGLAAGFRLTGPDRMMIGIAMLGARRPLKHVFVPTILSEPDFDGYWVRAHHVLDVLEADEAERAQAEPEWIAGLCAETSLHANVITNAAHIRTFKRAELSVHRHIAQQVG